MMKSITIFSLILCSLFLSPYLSQQLEFDDRYLSNRQLDQGMVAAINDQFNLLTDKMNTEPRLYAEVTIFPHFYSQLDACTANNNENQHRPIRLTEACDELLIFLQDLDLLPRQYRRNTWTQHPADRWLKLEQGWLDFYRRHSSQGGGEVIVDHPVEVPQQYLPLLDDPLHLREHLVMLPNGGGATISYRHLKDEFLRNQAVYATKTHRKRRYRAFHRGTRASNNRLLKLKVIFLLMMGEQWLDSHANLQMLAHVGAAVATLPVRAGPSRRKHPAEEDDEEDDHNQVGKLFKEGGDSVMRSMNKEGSKNQLLKKASALVASRGFGLVTLLTLGFIAATIAFIWALFTLFGSNFFQQKEQQEEEEATFSGANSNSSI